jgi:hypothetical protein
MRRERFLLAEVVLAVLAVLAVLEVLEVLEAVGAWVVEAFTRGVIVVVESEPN